MLENKPVARLDYTYCVNKNCKEKLICARYFGNYEMKKDILYSFCFFDDNNCIESEEANGYKRVTKTDKK